MRETRTMPNGLQIGKRTVPLGVIGAIYESRPNVTVDISALCLKSGNAVVLRGGSEAIHSNKALAALVQEAIARAGAPPDAVQLIENQDRALVGQMLKMDQYIDMLIPRGGADLIRRVAAEATMPVITGGIGVCHTYVDRAADIAKAVPVVHNAKCRKFSICNALDTVLVHTEIAEEFLPAIGRSWTEAGVEMRCDERSLRVLKAQEIPEIKLTPAAPDDFGREFLSLVAAVKTVDAIIHGSYEGDMVASGTVEVTVTGKVTGNIETDSLVIAKGGFFNGNVVKKSRTAGASVVAPEYPTVEKLAVAL
jgi:glutamate-5-semialdehyde dehydrogenase